MTTSAPVCTVRLGIARPTPSHDADMEYEVWIPQGDVRRIVRKNGEWMWTEPYETWDGHGEKGVYTGPHSVNIVFRFHKTEFRSDQVPPIRDVYTYDMETAGESPLHIASLDTVSEDEECTAMLTTSKDSFVAFGVNAYRRTPRNVYNMDHTTMRWVGSAIVPWSFLIPKKEGSSPEFAAKIFMWSDVRMKVGVTSFEHLVVKRQTIRHTTSDAVNYDWETNLYKILEEYTYLEFMQMTTHEVPREIYPNLSEEDYDDINTVRLSTLNTHTEGIHMPRPAPGNGIDLKGQMMQHKYIGTSAQSWYVYETPVVTEAWILARLREVWWLHQYDGKSYVKDADELIRSHKWGENTQKYKRMLTDVVRLVTMHATSSPYCEDFCVVDGVKDPVPCDSYCSALSVPGDCEDGAHSAYMIYMSILFGKWTDPTVQALRRLAAMIGVPVCITGVSSNPMQKGPNVGGTHAFGAVIPFPRFIEAVYGKDAVPKAKERFKVVFGYEYVDDVIQNMDTAAIETTLFYTPLTRGHDTHPPIVQEVYDKVVEYAAKELGETHCAFRNVSYPFILSEDRAVHAVSIKAFTSFHRAMGLTGVPTLMSGEKATEYSCTFVFMRPDHHGIGVTRDELFYLAKEDRVPRLDWTLRVPVAMFKEMFERDMTLFHGLRRPIVTLVPRVRDPLKVEDKNHEFVIANMNSFSYAHPHVGLFAFDVTYTYKDEDGDDTALIQKIEELKRRIGARSWVAHPYDKSVAIVMCM